jgi:hypothetical protein
MSAPAWKKEDAALGADESRRQLIGEAKSAITKAAANAVVAIGEPDRPGPFRGARPVRLRVGPGRKISDSSGLSPIAPWAGG